MGGGTGSSAAENAIAYDWRDIRKVLPHRGNALLLEGIIIRPTIQAARGYIFHKKIERLCHGHFPGNPVVPGIALIEFANQTCAMLCTVLTKTPITGTTGVRLRQLGKCDFYEEAIPDGDNYSLACDAVLIRQRGPFAFFEASIHTGDGVRICAVKIVGAVVNNKASTTG